MKLIDPCMSPSLSHVFFQSFIVGGQGPCLSQRKHFETADLNRASWVPLNALEVFFIDVFSEPASVD